MAITSNLKDHIGFIIKFGGIYASIASFLTDFFKPVFNSTLICACVAGIMALTTLIFWMLHFASPAINKINNELHVKSNGYWFKSIFATSVLCCVIFTVMYFANKNAPDGYFAEKSSAVRNLQEDFGLIHKQLANIKDNTQKIAESAEKIEMKTNIISDNTQKTADNTSQLIQSSSEIKQVTSDIKDTTQSINSGVQELSTKADNLKKETSDDPRKELANRGISYNKSSFQQAISANDLDSVILFLQGGLSPNLSTDINARPITMELFFMNNDITPILNLLIENGLDFNKKLYPLTMQTIPNAFYNDFSNYNFYTELFDNQKPYSLGQEKFYSLADIIAFFVDYVNPNTLKYLKSKGVSFTNMQSKLNDILAHMKSECLQLIYSSNNTKEAFELPPRRFKVRVKENNSDEFIDIDGLFTQMELDIKYPHLDAGQDGPDIKGEEYVNGETCGESVYKVYNDLLRRFTILNSIQPIPVKRLPISTQQFKIGSFEQSPGSFISLGVGLGI